MQTVTAAAKAETKLLWPLAGTWGVIMLHPGENANYPFRIAGRASGCCSAHGEPCTTGQWVRTASSSTGENVSKNQKKTFSACVFFICIAFLKASAGGHASPPEAALWAGCGAGRRHLLLLCWSLFCFFFFKKNYLFIIYTVPCLHYVSTPEGSTRSHYRWE